jgi:hypothetical protein
MLLSTAVAQTPADPQVAKSLDGLGRDLDHDLFTAYNNCEMERFGSMLATDIEFYHDQSGLMRTRENVVAAVRMNICGKVRRDLVEGSLQTFELKGYGVVQLGSHWFCEAAAARCGGIARFVHLWRGESGNWQLSRVISYDHQAIP